jgi:predicted adenylyl cyclase CyaB
MKEIEAKIKLDDLSVFEKVDLIKIKEVRVLDIYFDNDFLKLKSQDNVFRLRRENDETFIAFKGPREKHENLSVREEIETEISSFKDAFSIVKGLRLEEIAKVEKIRTYFSINRYLSLSVTLDRYPFIGDFMEVEGEEVQVYDFLKEFDFDLKNVTKKSCYEILLEYCEEKKNSS